MKKYQPLLIGMPFTYKEIDFELLKSEQIEPILIYPKELEEIGEGKPAYYTNLSIDELSRIIKQSQCDAIVCYNDNFLIESAQLRTLFNIEGIQSREIQKYKYKSEMYQSVSDSVNTIPYMFVDESLTFEAMMEHLGAGPYFIKPDHRAGSEGTSVIATNSDFIRWKQKYHSSFPQSIVQPYCNSDLYHCELIVHNNDIKYIQARKYSYPNHQFLEGKIIASLPITDFKLKEKVEAAAVKVQQQLGFFNGVMHTEFFVTDKQELLFLETNIRKRMTGIRSTDPWCCGRISPLDHNAPCF